MGGMEQRPLGGCSAGERVSGVYLLLWPRRVKGGPLYFWLADGTTKMRARYSGHTQPEEGSFVRVEAQVVEVWGELRLEVEKLEIWRGEVERERFLPSCPHDIGEARRQFIALCESVGEKYRPLLDSFFKDGAFWDSFCGAPAAKKIHQAYPGGLLLHTLGVARICEAVCSVYPRLRRDLLLCAALLHDVGKVWEYRLLPRPDKTDAGRLVGHVVLGAQEVSRRAREVGIPPKIRLMLQHLLLSHHGRKEWGSPVEPAIPEAEVLHYADMLDSRLAVHFETRGDGWRYSDALGRYILGGEGD